MERRGGKQNPPVAIFELEGGEMMLAYDGDRPVGMIASYLSLDAKVFIQRNPPLEIPPDVNYGWPVHSGPRTDRLRSQDS